MCMLLQGCSTDSKVAYKMMGYSENIINEESVTVVDAFIEDGKISVVLKLDFETITLNDFQGIYLEKMGTGYDIISCDKEETIDFNGEDIFNLTHEGEVILIFRDSIISAAHQPSDYLFYMEYLNGNGTMSTHRFFIGEL